MRVVCPVCKEPTTWVENPWRPFCSQRCKTIDLGNWASEEYRIGGEPEDEEKEESSQDHSAD